MEGSPILSATQVMDAIFNPQNYDIARNWTFLVEFLVLSLILILVLLFKDSKVGATIALLGMVTTAFFSSVDKFDFFKMSPQGGVEARLRQTVAETQALNKVTRDLIVGATTAFIKMQGQMISNGGILMSPDANMRDKSKQELVSLLGGLGVTASQLESVDAADRDGVIRQYAFSLRLGVAGSIPSGDDRQKEIRVLAAGDGFSDPDKISKLISDLGIKDPKLDELVQDFKYYVTTGKQRRPEVWGARDNWFR